jgi:hypothetical protein
MTPITPLEGEVEMFTRGKMQPLFSLDTTLSNRQSMLSVVPEVESPAHYLEISHRDLISDKPRPMSEITEILDELDLIEDDMSEFEEDSDEAFEFQSVWWTVPTIIPHTNHTCRMKVGEVKVQYQPTTKFQHLGRSGI